MKRILLMDDDDILLELTSRLLIETGWGVSKTIEGQETLTVYAEAYKSGQLYDVVILDFINIYGIGAEDTNIGQKYLEVPKVLFTRQCR